MGIELAVAVVIAAVFLALGWFLRRSIGEGKLRRAEELSTKIISDAQKEAEIKKKEALLEARDEWYRAKSNFERETRAKRSDLGRLEKNLSEMESNLDRKVDVLNRKERDIQSRDRVLSIKERAITVKEAELSQLIAEENRRLERIAGMSSEDAKRQLIQNLESQARQEATQLIKQIKQEAEEKAEREAREVIVSAIQRCAAGHTVESTVSVVSLPNDEMKGRIIGREGRNIRSFETATGVDVIVDDTPEAVILSGYDPVRREVAKIALEKLILDGRIHPGRIEEVVAKASKEMEEMIKTAGEEACLEAGVTGLNPKLVRYLGKLKYRTSYGQNVLQHSKEVSLLAGLMAAELDLDPTMAKRAGLLHDIGKSVDREMEGPHTQTGHELAQKFGEPPEVLNTILGHHEDVEPTSLITVLVEAADAISGARPGARRETLEAYIKRLEKLEDIADSFPGVSKAYAIQAGREIRVIVEPQRIDDERSGELVEEIAEKIQSEMEYPGQIKVTLIRETRAVGYAK